MTLLLGVPPPPPPPAGSSIENVAMIQLPAPFEFMVAVPLVDAAIPVRYCAPNPDAPAVSNNVAAEPKIVPAVCVLPEENSDTICTTDPARTVVMLVDVVGLLQAHATHPVQKFPPAQLAPVPVAPLVAVPLHSATTSPPVIHAPPQVTVIVSAPPEMLYAIQQDNLILPFTATGLVPAIATHVLDLVSAIVGVVEPVSKKVWQAMSVFPAVTLLSITAAGLDPEVVICSCTSATAPQEWAANKNKIASLMEVEM